MPVANLQYGLAQSRLRNFDKAIGPLRKKRVTLQAGITGMGHYELGVGVVFENRRLEKRRRA